MTTNVAVIHDGCGDEPGGAAKVSAELAQVLDADMYVGRTGCRDWYEAKAPKQMTIYARHANRLPTMFRDGYVSYRTGKLHLPVYDVVVTSGVPAKFYQPESFQCHIHYTHHPPLRYAQWLGRGSLGGIRGNIRYVIRKLGMYVDWLEMQRVETILANSRTTRERIRRHYRREAKIVNPPIDYSDAPILGMDDRDTFFLYVGRLGPRKRLETLIEAFEQSDVRLVVAGKGPLKKRLERLADDIGANVEFKGWVSDDERERLMREAKGGIFLPEEEDFGMAIAELLCWGTPVIVADEPNPNHLVSEENGMCIKPTAGAVTEAVGRFDIESFDPESIADAARERFSRTRFEAEVKEAVLGD